MIFCTQCGTSLRDAYQFCWNCGAKSDIPERVPARPVYPVPHVAAAPKMPASAKMPALRRLGHVFGLDPRIAFLTLIIDMMLNAGDIATAGLLFPVSALAGVVLAFIAYRAQINWYGDDRESARIKAIILGLLTAIPTPLPELLYIPAGLVGIFEMLRRKESRL